MADQKVTKIEFVNAGFRAVLKSEGVRSIIDENAQRIAGEANVNGGCDGFQAKTVYGGKAKRYIGFVAATDRKAAKAESEKQALTRAIT